MSDKTKREVSLQQQQDAERQRQEDIKSVLATPAGRRFIWALLDERSGVFGPSFAGEAPHTTAYREGVRSVGIELVKELQRVSPGQYVLMVAEQLEELDRRSKELSEAEPDMDE